MKDNFLLKIKFHGKDWKDYDFAVNNFKKTEVLHKDLKPADCSVKLELLPNIELNNLLLGIEEFETPAQILKNGKPYFFGFIKKSFTISKTQKLQLIPIEIVSGGYLLKEKVGRDIFIKQKQTVTETVNEILDLAGVDRADIPKIDDVIYGVHLKPEDSFHKILTDILFEYGYVFNFNNEGKIYFSKLFLHKPKSKLNITGAQCLEKIEIEHKENKKTEINVDWDGVEIVEDEYAFKETEGAQMGYSCYLELRAAAFYKNAPDGVYIPYQSKYGEVIFAENVELELEADTGIVVKEFEPFNTRAFIKLKNSDNSFSKWIRKLNFKGKVYVKKSKNKSRAVKSSNSSKIQKVDAKYIYTKARADNLAHDLLNYYNLSNVLYKIKTKEEYPLGSVVTISDYGIGSGVCRILEKNEDVFNGRFEYIAETVGEYTPSTLNEEILILPKPPQDGEKGESGKDGDVSNFPKDTTCFLYSAFNENKPTIKQEQPAYTAWQKKIIEYDVTGKSKIEMTFEEALHDVIILSGELGGDFIFKPYFDIASGNGSKQYQFVYKLTGSHNLTITTEVLGTQKIQEVITSKSLGTGCYAIIDRYGNIWRFSGGISEVDLANLQIQFNEICQTVTEQTKTKINNQFSTANQIIKTLSEAVKLPPKGFSYIRFPGMKKPFELYPDTISSDWTKVDDIFAGCFLRLSGDNASKFNESNSNFTFDTKAGGDGGGQMDALQEHRHKYNGAYMNKSEKGGGYSYYYTRPSDYNSEGANGCRVDVETRPKNITIEIYVYKING